MTESYFILNSKQTLVWLGTLSVVGFICCVVKLYVYDSN